MRKKYVLKDRTVRDEGFVPFAFGAKKGGALPVSASLFRKNDNLCAKKCNS